MEGQDILYEVKDKVAIITLNVPRELNALNQPQYLLLGYLVEKAEKDPNTIITFIRSTGRYFSAGANVKGESGLHGIQATGIKATEHWLNNFVSRNAYLTSVFYDHTKLLVCALNGPVVGLSSALVALCDFVYAINDNVFMLTPFANLGLVSEGAAAATLVKRLGWSVANEALLLSRPIKAKRLYELGMVNKIYNMNDTDKFNDAVLEEFWTMAKDLDHTSIIDIKKLLKANFLQDLQSTNANEIIGGLNKWLQQKPQKRFAKISQKQMKHKL
ncbi:CYFA0S09e00188g1_1 [Cyberlindnera fabianii]|uniref:3,2-trans-enoyl-CoA isomerase n=1 Tax=Cyberlindnera fabianii TaxID=36022 RepID=A0A061AYG7_CYBFA|nr:3,2-trans-enoyl-CoA isomerase [Cyberlindnera fabianii]CDR42287.1 CYFA0S09e00188g1_1 [Cyberlindnera fabianii]